MRLKKCNAVPNVLHKQAHANTHAHHMHTHTALCRSGSTNKVQLPPRFRSMDHTLMQGIYAVNKWQNLSYVSNIAETSLQTWFSKTDATL